MSKPLMIIFIILTGIALGTSIWANVTNVTNEDVLLMIDNNAPKAHDHTHSHNIEHNHTNVDIQLAGIQSELDRQRGKDNSLQQQFDENSLPTQNDSNSGQSNFRLDIDKEFIAVGDSFTLTGLDKANTPFILSMVGPNGKALPNSGQTKSNGQIEISLFVPNSWSAGPYTITVIIGQDFDMIHFGVAPGP